jgi:hypothetical protein
LFSAEHWASPKHASHGVQQWSTVHWEHAADGVLTGFVQLPRPGGLICPVPMPMHSVAQLFDQQASMPPPSCVPLGYFVSHAEIQAASGSPPPPFAPFVEPDEEGVPPSPVPRLSGGRSAPEHAKTPRIAPYARVRITLRLAVIMKS